MPLKHNWKILIFQMSHIYTKGTAFQDGPPRWTETRRKYSSPSCKTVDIFPDRQNLYWHSNLEGRISRVLRLRKIHQWHHTSNQWGKEREAKPHCCLSWLRQRTWIHFLPVDLQRHTTLPCSWSYTEYHHQSPGWNSATIYCWRQTITSSRSSRKWLLRDA